MLKVKTCFDCKMFDVSNWVAHLSGEDGPGGTPSHETFSVSPQGPLEIFLVFGHPPSLVSDFSAYLKWQNPANAMKGADLHPYTTVSKFLQMPHIKVSQKFAHLVSI